LLQYRHLNKHSQYYSPENIKTNCDPDSGTYLLLTVSGTCITACKGGRGTIEFQCSETLWRKLLGIVQITGEQGKPFVVEEHHKTGYSYRIAVNTHRDSMFFREPMNLLTFQPSCRKRVSRTSGVARKFLSSCRKTGYWTTKKKMGKISLVSIQVIIQPFLSEEVF
jgi:hypothetical protein